MNRMNQSNSFSKPSLLRQEKQKLILFNHKSVQKEQDRINSKSRKNIFSKKTQINLKQYTNKFLRSNNAFQQKQNEKLTHFNRLYLFTRKNKALRHFKQKKFLTCITQPRIQNEQLENIENTSNNDKLSRFSHQRIHNYSQFDTYCINTQNRQSSILKEICNNQNQFAVIKSINQGMIQFKRINNLEKEKISTSRALEKYSKIVRQNGVNVHASHNFEKKQEKPRSYQSYDENNQQIRVVSKKIKSENQLKPLKNYFKKQRIRTIQKQMNYKDDEQQFDLKGW